MAPQIFRPAKSNCDTITSLHPESSLGKPGFQEGDKGAREVLNVNDDCDGMMKTNKASFGMIGLPIKNNDVKCT